MTFQYQNCTLEILYEDNHILVIDKTAGLLSQADKTGDLDVLTVVKEYLRITYNKQGNIYLGLLHRLDRPVSGIMVLAKTSKAASRLSKQIRQHEWTKIYYAICEGSLSTEKKITQYLLKDGSTNKVKVFEKPLEKTKKADLHISPEKQIDDLSLIKIHLHSGRSHQIRAQLSAAKLPIWGDIKYGAKRHPKAMDLALRAMHVRFKHPVQDKIMQFDLSLPHNKTPWDLFSD